MTIQGGNIETKEIGIQTGTSGTHIDTEYNETLQAITLKKLNVDSNGAITYVNSGSWISSPINLGDRFKAFEKVITTGTNTGASKITVSTRVSDNGSAWSSWLAVGSNGEILSESKQYIQIKIDFVAGTVDAIKIVSNTEFETNEFVEVKELSQGKYTVPKLTSNTSELSLGKAFANSEFSSITQAWKAFDDTPNTQYRSADNVLIAYVGFLYNTPIVVNKYKIGSFDGLSNATATQWSLEASNDTTTGVDGTWIILNTNSKSDWAQAEVIVETSINNDDAYKCYRVKLEKPMLSTMNHVAIGSVNFYEAHQTEIKLKRDYEYGMTNDELWVGEGSLHKKKITRNEWLRIDKLEVM